MPSPGGKALKLPDKLDCECSSYNWLDRFSVLCYNDFTAEQTYLRGAGCIRLRSDLVVLTREPDTVSTVVGKDAR